MIQDLGKGNRSLFLNPYKQSEMLVSRAGVFDVTQWIVEKKRDSKLRRKGPRSAFI